MAEQATDTTGGTGAVAGVRPGETVPHGTHEHSEHNPGRPISWFGTSVVTLGFIVGGASLIPGPHWIWFWVGAGIAIIGCLILAFSKAMNTDWY